MKKIKKITVLLIVLFTIISCSKKTQDDQLSGFLLLGPYAILSKPQSIEILNDDLSDEEMLQAYKQIFEFPYPASASALAKSIMLKDFNATDKATSLKAIEKKLNESKNSDKKAFSYAVAANAASFGYSAGYLTKQEVLDYNSKILKEVRNNYDDWESYLIDFKEGRRAQKLPNQDLFDLAVDTFCLEDSKSPYINVEL